MDDNFAQLMVLVAPEERRLVAVLAAYFDASSLPGGVFAVAGLAFDVPQAKKLSKELKSLFAPYGGVGHMTDLHARKRNFKSLHDNPEEVSRLTTSQIEIINSRLAFGVGVGVDMAELDAVLPKHIEGFGHAYPFCCHMAMTALGALVRRERGTDEISYVFESGDEHEPEAHRFMQNVHVVPVLKESYLHSSHSFMSKADSPPLMAADAFAWEYARYWELSVKQQKIPMRKSFASLLSSGRTTLEFQRKFSVNFLTGPLLWNNMDKIRDLWESDEPFF